MANQNVFILVSLGLLACLVRLTVSQDYCRVSSLSNGVHAHPTTCNQYILCLDGATRTYSCPPQLVFDPVVRACVDSSIAHPCNPSTAGQVTSASQGYCALYSWPSGVHPHPTTCQLYILCEQGITHVLPCSSGLLFDLVYGACVDANIANPCHATTAPPVTAVNQDYCRLHGMVNGIHSHPLTCQQYILCTNGNTHIYSCESGLLFEATFNACVDNHLAVTCSNHGVTVNPVTSAGLSTVCETYKLQGGIYPDPANCDYFIECLDGITHIMQCPDGLKFNVRSGSCEHHGNVDCSLNYAYSFQHVSG
ncbi:unnamed protein product [Lymnaea stagnalis]|uniref:Chitin-binding type-2 domain-containing protein n=1 Tax=Lymnaea stagnalis TaxID=6523 RepID=A0AAV2HMT2_LYMST